MRTEVLETSEDAVLGGRACASRSPAIASATMRSCSPPLLPAAPANMRSTSAPASAPPGSRWRRALPGSRSLLVEIDPALAALAAGNARLNRLDDRVDACALDVEDRHALTAALVPGSVDRVLMNPPFLDAARQNLSPDPRRRLAHAATPGLLLRWVAAAADLLKPQGVLTLIWRADALAAVRGRAGGRVRRDRRAAGLSTSRRSGDPRIGARGEIGRRPAGDLSRPHPERPGRQADRGCGGRAAWRGDAEDY